MQRTEIFSRALSEAARRSRSSSRSRRMTAGGGFSVRRGAALFRLFAFVSFIVVVVFPTLFGVIYFGWLASNQYVAEAKFILRSGGGPLMDSVAIMTGLPPVTVVQDTQIVTNYILSRGIVEKLEKRVNLRERYDNNDIDRLARFDKDKPIEKFVKYWSWMTHVAIQMPSGIVVVRVSAFRPEDAAIIAQAVVDLSESLVNDMNERIRRDSVASSEQEFSRAADRLTKTLVAMETVRNQEQILDADQAAKGLNELKTSLDGERIKLQQEYDTQSRYVLEQAPQMRALKTKIAAMQAQIDQVQGRMTAQRTSANPNEPTLSESMSRFSSLGLEHQIAQKQYAAAATTLEISRASTLRKQIYLTTFVKPAIPEDSTYPSRFLYPLYIIIASLTLWGALYGCAVTARNHMA